MSASDDGSDRRRRALGRGLDALLPSPRREPSGAGQARGGDSRLPIASIEPNPDQPRKRFDPAEMQKLVESMSRHGAIQPIVVRRISEGRFRIIAGERRWRAAQKAGLTDIPCILRDASEIEALELALHENLHREDLNPIDLAGVYRRYADDLGYSQERIAELAGMSRPAIANTIRLLSLPAEVQRMVSEGVLSEGHARAVLLADGMAAQTRAAREAASRGLSVRQTEKLARSGAAKRDSTASGKRASARSPEVKDLELRLARALGTRVEVVSSERSKSKGMLRIHYGSLDELDAIIARLTRR